MIAPSQQAVARYCAGRLPERETIARIHAETAGAVTVTDRYDLPPAAPASAAGEAA